MSGDRRFKPPPPSAKPRLRLFSANCVVAKQDKGSSNRVPYVMSDTPLDRFRAETGIPRHLKPPPVLPPIPRRQQLLVFNTLVWFALTLFWFRGGLGLWGSFVSLGMGVWTFLWLFLPAAPLSETDPQDGTPWAHLKRLFTFPVFWAGLPVLAYGLVQTLNPAYELVPVPGKGAMMQSIDFIEWLPSGVRVPLFMTNSPRAGLLQIALPWLMLCSLWVGLRSRRALDWLLNAVLAIVALWTLMALGYYYTGAESIYWGIEMGRNNTPWFWGTFLNPNHGGMLQLFGLLLAFGLAGRGFKRALLTRHFSGIQVFYLAVALFLSVATLQSLSRGAILLMALVWLGALLVGGTMAYRERSFKMVGALAGFLVLLLIGGVIWFVTNTQSGQGRKNPLQRTLLQTSKQFEDIQAGEADKADNRVLLNRVSMRMFKTSPVYGYGIGSWSYFYRNHVDFFNEIDLLIAYYSGKDPEGNRMEKGIRYAVPMHFDHAHNEYFQMLCELGVLGSVCLLLLLLTVFLHLARFMPRGGLGFLGLIALAAALAIALYSLIEFPLRTPALGLFAGLFFAAAALEAEHRHQRTGQALKNGD